MKIKKHYFKIPTSKSSHTLSMKGGWAYAFRPKDR